MYCQKCGNQMNESAAFCTKCGTPVGGGVDAANYSAVSGQSSLPTNKAVKGNVLGLVALALSLVGLLSSWLFVYPISPPISICSLVMGVFAWQKTHYPRAMAAIIISIVSIAIFGVIIFLLMTGTFSY
jgi:hypothetical protein